MNGRDIHRIATNPRAMMNLQAGNIGAVQRFVDERNREDKIDEATRLLRQMNLTGGQAAYRLRDRSRLLTLQRTLKDTHGNHRLYRQAQALLDELVREQV